MKKTVSYLVMIALLFCVGCSMKLSTEELSTEIEKSINEALASKHKGLTVKSLTLIKASENNYSGVVTISNVQKDSSNYDIKVIYDGENMKWEIPNLYIKLLSIEVEQSVSEYFISKNINLDIESLILIKKTENNYLGKLTISNEEGESKQCDIEVITNGENTNWEISESSDALLYFSLSKEKRVFFNILRNSFN